MRSALIFLAAMVFAAFAAGCDYTKKHTESLAVVEPVGVSGHNVTVRYKLVGDELTGVGVRYSLDGRYWHPATKGWGGEGVMGLTATPRGADHIFVWDSLADIGKALSLNVMVKIIPWGREDGFEDNSSVFIVNNTVNTRPTAIIFSNWNPASPEQDNILVQYGVADSEGDAVTAVLQFSIDGGANYFDATLTELSDSPARLKSTFPTESNDGGNQLSAWNLTGLNLGSNTDAAGKLYVDLGATDVLIYSDSGMSSLVAQGTYTVNGAVTLTSSNDSGLSGSVNVAYTADDGDIELECFTAHSAIWDTLNDIGRNNQPDVRLRVKVIDGEAVHSETTETSPSYTPDTSPVKQLAIDNSSIGMFIDDSWHLASLAGETRSAVTGDFDDDGDIDIFVGRLGENYLYRNDGGQFSLHGQGVSDDTQAVVSADFDDDGVADIFAANKGWSLIYYGGAGQAIFTTEQVGNSEDVQNAGCRDPSGAQADFDNDGNPDVFVCGRSSSSVWLNPGTAGFSAAAVGVLGDDCRGAAIADFDGDGELDVFCCCRGQDRLLLGDGAGSFTVAAAALADDLGTSLDAAVFDLEGDGDWDLYVGRWGPNRILVNQGGDQGGTEGVFRSIGGMPQQKNNTRSVAVFTRNGATYLVEGNDVGQSALYRLYTGATFDLVPLEFPASWATVRDVQVARAPDDFDNDGLSDIFVAGRSGNMLLLGQ